MIRNNPELREKLAAEYVLGTLKGGARRRFETWLSTDAPLREIVLEWQTRLLPLVELSVPVTPPARVWSGIERRLGLGGAAPQAAWWQFWRSDARLWSGLALASTTAAVLLAVLLAQRSELPALHLVATLTDQQARAAVVLAADAARGRINVRVIQGLRVPEDRTLQLWAITTAGKPRSLGILPDNRGASLALDARAVGPDVMLLAVSLEPKGGSPDPAGPTGPVLYKGSWIHL
jgi:anti-sigma-K factor RskA